MAGWIWERQPSVPAVALPQRHGSRDNSNVEDEAQLRRQAFRSQVQLGNEVDTGDPNDASKYAYKGSFTGGRPDLSAFTPGATLWVRVRKIGTKGETGGWSDPASIMVT